MLNQTTLEEFKKMSQRSKRVVVSKEIFGDYLTPVGVFQALAKDQEAALLDSAEHSTSADACIYMGFDPLAKFHSFGQRSYITNGLGETQQVGNALEALRQFYNEHKCSSDHPLAKFAGGMIGFTSYDAIRIFEDIPERHANQDNIPDLCFKFYGTNIVFDKRSGKVLVSKIVIIKNKPEEEYGSAMQAIDQTITEMMSNQQPTAASLQSVVAKVETDIDDAGFAKMVEKAKHYIKQGDAFQVVPSRRFRQQYLGDDFNIYRALRVLNPSTYQFFIRNKDFTIVGASPERLVSLQQGFVEIMPIAGTRRRGKTYEEDVAMEKDLINDQKEIAEHMMLVDLGRNDVGAISKPGSVEVSEFKQVHRYSSVMHIVSRVKGKLRKGFDAFDVIKAVFPAGTLSGAPKIRAMEIIDEIETSRRGVYGGGVIAIDNEGQMDSCITIRTAFVKDGVASVRAGAGVVLDSDPQLEANETRHKAQTVLDALELAQRGFV